MAQVIVYIDGFNLYYGSLKKSPYKWVDLNKLCARMLPGDQILQIKYFTAKVSGRPNDPDKHIRQEIYLRALKTIPNLKIYFGHFLTHSKRLPLSSNLSKMVWVDVTEEKGSDVNIAAHMVRDASKGLFEVGVLLSNDGDLQEALRIVREDFQKSVGVLNPHQIHSTVLKSQATFIKRIRQSDIIASQFPHTLTDHKGTFTKPSTW